MNNIEYLTDINGKKKAVVVPIELWQKIISNDINSDKNLPEDLENYCLNKATEKVNLIPLLNAKSTLTFQEQKIPKPGLHLGAISMADDFDESLPDGFWLGEE